MRRASFGGVRGRQGERIVYRGRARCDWYRADASLTTFSFVTATNTNTFVAFASAAEPTQATAAMRLGTPANPATFQGDGPLLGATWQTSLTPFVPGAFVDFVVIAAAPANLPSPIGTYLFDPFDAYFVCAFAAGAPLQVGIPGNCALVGLGLVAQAGSVSFATCAFANALDVTIGTF